jgi:hypothetical protein
MKKFRILSLLLGASLFFAVGCTKDNTNGPAVNSSISGTVTYQNGDGTSYPTVNPVVEVAFNKTSATTSFDLKVIGNSDGTYAVKGLGAGDYFVTATYTDPVSGFMYTCAGSHIKLGNDKDGVTANFTLQ